MDASSDGRFWTTMSAHHDVVATLKGCENQDCGITKDEEGLAVFTLQSEVPGRLG